MPEEPVITLADYSDLCGENPLWDATTQHLYWTDLTGRRFYWYDWKNRQSLLINQEVEICGAAFNEPAAGDDARWVVVNSGGIWLWNGSGPPRVIVSEVEGQRCVAILAAACFM